MSAIMGTFVRIQTMADGSPRIILDLTCSLSDVAAMGLSPGAPFCIARMTQEASIDQARKGVAENLEKPGQLCIMAANFCKDPMFWNWANDTYFGQHIHSEEDAKKFILLSLRIASRKEIDTNLGARNDFLEYIRNPFMTWKRNVEAKAQG